MIGHVVQPVIVSRPIPLGNGDWEDAEKGYVSINTFMLHPLPSLYSECLFVAASFPKPAARIGMRACA